MKSVTNILLMVLIMVNFSNCSSAQKLQKESPVNVGKAYYQYWVAGVKGGGAGMNLFVEIDNSLNKPIQFDSIYFRGKVSKIEIKPNNKRLLIGRFSSKINQKKDIIMSNKPNAEYGNEMPKLKEKIPFNLKDDECVVSYKEGDKTKYFKIENIVEEKPNYFPSAPPKKQ